MKRKLSMRGLVVVSGLAGAVLLLEGCQQQGAGEPDLAVAGSAAALTQDSVVPTGQACTPTGKHAQHGTLVCTTCHQCAGTLSFNPAIAGPTAAFDAVTKNCSNVACHSVASGTFSYSYWDWGADALAWVSVPYGGQAGSGSANWYAAPGSGSCTACHDFTPRYNGARYAWHSGTHGGSVSDGNTCQLCHPDATGAYVYSAYINTSGGLITSCAPGTYCASAGTITNASLHGNGVIDVAPRWGSSCFGCH